MSYFDEVDAPTTDSLWERLMRKKRRFFRYGGWYNRKSAMIGNFFFRGGLKQKIKQTLCRHEWQMKIYNAMTDCQNIGFLCKKCGLYRDEKDM